MVGLVPGKFEFISLVPTRAIWVVLILHLFIITSCKKEESNFIIEGVITSKSTGDPVENAFVTLGRAGLSAADYEVWETTSTDQEGKYQIRYTYEGVCTSFINLSARKVFSDGSALEGGSLYSGIEIQCIEEAQSINLSLECTALSCPE